MVFFKNGVKLRQAAYRAGTPWPSWGPLFIQLNCKEKLNSSPRGSKPERLGRACLSRGASLGIDLGNH